jgi:hypothetical protein
VRAHPRGAARRRRRRARSDPRSQSLFQGQPHEMSDVARIAAFAVSFGRHETRDTMIEC